MRATSSPHVEILPPLRRDADDLSELEWLAELMDSRFRIPGTQMRIGLDAIMGLVPGIGDAASAVVSAYIFQRLRRLELPWHVQARMAGNIFLDFALGAIPLLGDLLDAGFKANRANIALAKRHLGKPRPQGRAHKG